MVYDGLIGLRYSDFKEDGVGYIDAARKAISLASGDVDGFTREGTVFVLFNLLDEVPMVISEKFETAQEDAAAIQAAVKKFNKLNQEYVAVIAETDEKYTTIVTTGRDIYNTVTDVL